MMSLEEQTKLDRQLIDAFAGRNPNLVKELVESGADVNCNINGGARGILLFMAAGIHESTMLETLLECGADPNMEGDGSLRATHEAVMSENQGFITILHSFGADIDASCIYDFEDSHGRNLSGMTPLHIASLLGHTSIVKELLDCGADIDLLCSDGKRAIDYHDRLNDGKEVYVLLSEAKARRSKENLYTELYGDGIDVDSVGQATPGRKRKM